MFGKLHERMGQNSVRLYRIKWPCSLSSTEEKTGSKAFCIDTSYEAEECFNCQALFFLFSFILHIFIIISPMLMVDMPIMASVRASNIF